MWWNAPVVQCAPAETVQNAQPALSRPAEQCAKFHELTCFKSTRRTCREKLEHHNALQRRRRKASNSCDRTNPLALAETHAAGLTDSEASDGEARAHEHEIQAPETGLHQVCCSALMQVGEEEEQPIFWTAWNCSSDDVAFLTTFTTQ